MSAVLCFTCVLIFLFWLFVNFVSVSKNYASSGVYGTMTFMCCQTALILLALLAVVFIDSSFNLATYLLPSVRKFICAAYSKASLSCSVSNCLSFSCFIRYFVRKMSVAVPQTILSTDPPTTSGSNAKSLFEHSASCSRNFILSYCYFSIFSKFRYKNDRLSNICTSISESLSTSVWLCTTFCTSWHLALGFFTNFSLSYWI
jgi:hypothetical protein